MPYSAAATCLHMSAQSGQLHESWISAGEGNRPCFCRQIRSMTPLDNRPCSNSTSESMAPPQSLQMDFHCALATGATFSETLYKADPLTSAWILPGAICKSTTDRKSTRLNSSH